MTETPNVTQAKLNIAHNEVTQVSPSDLKPHPKNEEIYGDTDDRSDLTDEFVESIESKGVLEPLTVNDDDKIVSGHRRWLAAKEVGLATVPVRYESFESDLHEREAIIEFNRQREKKPGQIVNEFEEMLAIEEERAKDRKAHGETAPGKSKDGDASGNVSGSDSRHENEARERAAEKVNSDVSGRTLEKGLRVKEKAKSDEESEKVQETAQEAWDGLQAGSESFNSAYTKVKDAENTQDDGHTVVDAATKQETDEWSSPRELVEPLSEVINGFDLDPCSGAEVSPFAESTYTKADDGLVQDWFGQVWVNPPYSDMESWTEKVIDETTNTDTVYLLCKGDTSTEWWQRTASSAKLICAIDHRLQFGNGENSAPFPSHILVFGDISKDEIKELENHGLLLRPGDEDE